MRALIVLACTIAVSVALAAPPAVIYAESEAVTGAQLVATQPHGGQQCVQWKHGANDGMRFGNVARDWTPWNTLTLWVRTDTPGGASWMLIIPSEDDTREGSDYYSASISVQPGGWRRVTLSLKEDMGVNRTPKGWDQIGGMTFTAAGWGQTVNPEAVVYVDDVQLEATGPVLGPRLNDEEFFGALNFATPGLEQVKAASVAGDWPAARKAYAAYLKSLPHPWKFDWKARPAQAQANPNTRGADETMARRFVVCSVPYDFKGGDIDWTVNPTNPVNNEWIWQFSRHGFWAELGRAYWNTLDEKYAQEFVWQLEDWIHDCPVPVGKVNNNAGSRWRTIECGIRMAGPWPDAFLYFLSSPSFTDDAIMDMVKSMVEHARYLKQYPTSGNWLTMECNGLYHVGALFPEFAEAASWRDTAVARLYKDLDVQVYADGAQIELAPGYHQVSLYNFLGLVETAQLTGQTLPADYLTKLERMWDYDMWLMGPDGTSPAFNDSGCDNLRGRLVDGRKYFPNRTDWQWLTTKGAQGKPPSETSHACKWAGHYIMRSGWGPEDLWCAFDAGPFGYGHQHEDKLGFVMSAYGSRLVIDTGVYTYDASEWRRYVLGATAHSTVFVDGKGQERRGAPRETYVNKAEQTNPWFSTAGLDYATGTYDEGFGRAKEKLATHRREMIFVKPDYWIIVDTLLPTDANAHDYTAYFHLRPAEAKVMEGTRNIMTDNGSGANLAILPVGPEKLQASVIKGQKDPFTLGWTLKTGLECEPIPVATYRWQANGPSQVAYVFYPLRPGQRELPVVTPTAAGMTVKAGDRIDTIVLADKFRVTVTRQVGDKVEAAMRVELP